jgi:hypothetical protein
LFRIQFSRARRWRGLLLLPGVAAVAALAGGVVAAERMDGGSSSPLLRADWQRGVNLTAFQPGAYAEDTAARALLTARSAGTGLVALTPTWYMDAADSTAVAADPDKTPSDASVLAAAARAHELGLNVVIKPHVDVRDGTFRGEIAPADRDAWFASYSALVRHYASLAADADATAFVVGTELTSMAGDEDEWRALIEEARGRFDGEITFAANWVEGAEAIEFWDALDAIGIDAYMPLGTDPEPSVDDLVAAWGPNVDRMELLNERWDLPVVFTELGYESRVGTAARIGAGTAPISEEAQADAYEAAFEALSPVSWFSGIWWWEWSAEGLGRGPGDGSFSPEGKDAAEVLRRWQAG